MSTVKHAVIAAAGFGSRLGMGRPKCLLEFRGRTLLERQLQLLVDVPDVRLVVGFEESAVMDLARRFRPDILFVRNAAYASTTTLDSYTLGARFLNEPCLFMDADILFEKESFGEFRDACGSEPLIGYTRTKTVDAVYVGIAANLINWFDREVPTEFEWANLAFLPPNFFEGGSGTVFEHLAGALPLRAQQIESYEIDRPEDLDIALAHYRDSRDWTGSVEKQAYDVEKLGSRFRSWGVDRAPERSVGGL